MAKRLHYSIFTRMACVMLALHFFNFSIDPIDKYADSVPEDLSINDIESVSELIVEVVFSAGNVFAEHDEQDSDEGGSFGVCKLFFSDSGVNLDVQPPLNFPRQFGIALCERIISRASNVVSPPPKA
jgi:hypothetical protein